MFCMYCGKQVPDGANYCTFCSKSLRPEGQPEQPDGMVIDSPTPAPAEAPAEQKPEFKPYERAQHIRKSQPALPKDKQITMGITAWVLAAYSVLTIVMFLLGWVGFATSPEIASATYTFKNSSYKLLLAVFFLIGKSPAPTGAPSWIMAIIPVTLVVLSVIFAVIQFVRNRQKFSTVTLIVVGALAITMLLLNVFLYETVMTGLGVAL